MSDKFILHMLTPLAHMSPFDVNMALDAGFDVVATYTNVSLAEVLAADQDAMFSRSPRDALRTGIFIGGKDAFLALDMLDAAAKALLKPFEISLFADPAGSFTTAAAMLAGGREDAARDEVRQSARGAEIAIFGATGVVGTAAGVIGALEGAQVTFVGHDGTARVERHAAEVKRRFGVDVAAADGSTPEGRRADPRRDRDRALRRQGRRAGARRGATSRPRRACMIAADVNAVPPLGVEGVELHAKGAELSPGGALGIGALAIGNIKYQTEFGLVQTHERESAKPLCLDFRDAFVLARTCHASTEPRLLIAAASGRALAAGARRAGFTPLVADVFDDADTREPRGCDRRAGDLAAGFEGARLIAALDELSRGPRAGRARLWRGS